MAEEKSLTQGENLSEDLDSKSEFQDYKHSYVAKLFDASFESIIEERFKNSRFQKERIFAAEILASKEQTGETCAEIINDFHEVADPIWSLVESNHLRIETLLDPTVKLLDYPVVDQQLDRFFSNLMNQSIEKNLEIQYTNWIIQNSLVANPVTGLPNKATGDLLLENLIEEEKKFAFAFFDLDKLGALNEALGPQITNKILEQLGERISSTLRKGNVERRDSVIHIEKEEGTNGDQENKDSEIFHPHGDEFYLIFNNADFRGGLVAAKKVLSEINKEPFKVFLDEEEIDFIKHQESHLLNSINEDEKKAKKGDVKKYEEAMILLKDFLSQIEEGEVKSSERNGEKTQLVPLEVNLSASIGCSTYSPGEQISFSEIEKHGDKKQLAKSLRDKLITEAASASKISKKRERNTVTGYQKGSYVFLDDDGEIKEYLLEKNSEEK